MHGRLVFDLKNVAQLENNMIVAQLLYRARWLGWAVLLSSLMQFSSCKQRKGSQVKQLEVKQSHQAIRPDIIRVMYDWYIQDSSDRAMYHCQVNNLIRPVDNNYLSGKQRRITELELRFNLWEKQTVKATFDASLQQCTLDENIAPLNQEDQNRIVNSIRHPAVWQRVYDFYFKSLMADLWDLTMLAPSIYGGTEGIYKPLKLFPLATYVRYALEHMIILTLGQGSERPMIAVRRLELYSLALRIKSLTERLQKVDPDMHIQFSALNHLVQAIFSNTSAFKSSIIQAYESQQTDNAAIKKEQIIALPVVGQNETPYRPAMMQSDAINQLVAIFPQGKEFGDMLKIDHPIAFYRFENTDREFKPLFEMPVQITIQPKRLFDTDGAKFFRFANADNQKLEAILNAPAEALAEGFTIKALNDPQFDSLCQRIFASDKYFRLAFAKKSLSLEERYSVKTNVGIAKSNLAHDFQVKISGFMAPVSLQAQTIADQPTTSIRPVYTRVQFADLDIGSADFSGFNLPHENRVIRCVPPISYLEDVNSVLPKITVERTLQVNITSSNIVPIIVDTFKVNDTIEIAAIPTALIKRGFGDLTGLSLPKLSLDASYRTNTALEIANEQLAVVDRETGLLNTLIPNTDLRKIRLQGATYLESPYASFIWGKFVGQSPYVEGEADQQLNCLWLFDAELRYWTQYRCMGSDFQLNIGEKGLHKIVSGVNLQAFAGEDKVIGAEKAGKGEPETDINEGWIKKQQRAVFKFLKQKPVVIHHISGNKTWAEVLDDTASPILFDFHIDFTPRKATPWFTDRVSDLNATNQVITDLNAVLIFNRSKDKETSVVRWNFPSESRFIDPDLFFPRIPKVLGTQVLGRDFELELMATKTPNIFFRQLRLPPMRSSIIRGEAELESSVKNWYSVQDKTITDGLQTVSVGRMKKTGKAEYDAVNVQFDDLKQGLWKLDDGPLSVPTFARPDPEQAESQTVVPADGNITIVFRDNTQNERMENSWDNIPNSVASARERFTKLYIQEARKVISKEVDGVMQKLENEAAENCDALENVDELRKLEQQQRETIVDTQLEQLMDNGMPFVVVSLIPAFDVEAGPSTKVPFPLIAGQRQNANCDHLQGLSSIEHIPAVNFNLCQLQPLSDKERKKPITFTFSNVPEGLYHVLLLFPFSGFVRNYVYSGHEQFVPFNPLLRDYIAKQGQADYAILHPIPLEWPIKDISAGIYSNVLILGNHQTKVDAGYRYYYVNNYRYPEKKGQFYSQFLMKVLDRGPVNNLSAKKTYTIE